MTQATFYSDTGHLSTDFSSLTLSDGENLLATIYVDIASTFTLAGNDSNLLTVQYNSTGTFATIVADSVADHKTKEQYSFTLIATTIADSAVSSQILSVSVTAVTTPTFTLVAYSSVNPLVSDQVSVNNLTIADNAKEGIFQFATDESVSGAVFTLNGGTDDALFALTSGGVLSLNTYASYHTQSSYTIKVLATAVYGSLTSELVMIIDVTDGNPIFLTSDNGPRTSGEYTFNVADASNVLTNGGSMYSTDLALYTLTGTDAGLFTVSPTTSGTASKIATLSLTSNALFQTQSSYSVTIVATDPSGNVNSTPQNITVTVNQDDTAPVLTLHDLAGFSTLDGSAFTINDNNGTGVGSISSSEPCTFEFVVVPGWHSDLFDINVDASGTTAVITLKTATAINLDAIYYIKVKASDLSAQANSTIKDITVYVFDETKPVLTVTSVAVASGTNTFTNLQSVPFVITTSEILSTDLSFVDIILKDVSDNVLATSDAEITDFVGTTTGATFNITPKTENKLFKITIDANVIQDVAVPINGPNTNDAATLFQFQWDQTTPSIDITGNQNVTIPQGYAYADGGSVSPEGLVVVTTSNVDVKIQGVYYVTYTITDTAGNNRSKSRIVTVGNGRPKPVIQITNTPTTAYQISSSPFTTADDDVIFAPIYNEGTYVDNAVVNGAEILIFKDYTGVDRSTVNVAYTITYRSNISDGAGYGDIIYGDLDAILRTIAINDAINFTLGELNGLMLLTQLSLTSTEPLADTTMNTMPGIAINMPVAHWNSIFYLKPEADALGLANLSDLAHIDVFGTEHISYKTNSANLNIIPNLKTAYVNIDASQRIGGGNVNEYTGTQTIKEVVTTNWGYDIFGIENMSDLFANLSVVKSEIDAKFDISNSGLDQVLKAKIDLADNLDNSSNTLGNFTRQLVLQLHKVISSTNSKTRLTSSGMFDPSKQIDNSGNAYDKYYPFEFAVGDKLTFSMTFTSPVHDINNYYPSGASPSPVSIKVVVTMV